MRILLVALALPADTISGTVVLYRHILRAPQLEVGAIGCYGNSTNSLQVLVHPHPLLNRMARTRLSLWINSFIYCVGSFYDSQLINQLVKSDSWDLVLAAAEGWQWQIAQKLAKQLKLPLVTIFHDWWPDTAPIHSFARKILEKRFYDLFQASAHVFCVSEGMRTKLGDSRNSEVLYPIPHELFPLLKDAELNSNNVTELRTVYAGLLNGVFTRQLRSLSDFLLSSPLVLQELSALKVELRLFGTSPEWETPFYRGFVARSQLEEELSQADVLLVVVPFESHLRVWAETSFPSKLVEYCRFGRPILLWAPAYSAAAVWAEKHDAAALVTQPEPQAVLDEVMRLMVNGPRRRSLGERARYMAETMFHPDRIQEQFMQGLERVVREWREKHG